MVPGLICLHLRGRNGRAVMAERAANELVERLLKSEAAATPPEKWPNELIRGVDNHKI